MSIFPVFDTASSALTTNRVWMDAISDNLANVNTVKPYDQPAFQARFVQAQELPSNPGDPVGVGGGVTAAAVRYGSAEGILHSDPGNPLANKDGLVRSPDVEKRFASFAGPAAPAPEPAQYRGGTRVETRDLEQVHIAMALQGVPVRDEQLYSLQVFTSVLGGGMSSRLFQEVREKRGLCYTIQAFHMPYSDTGLFGLYAGTDESDAPELMRVVIDQIGNATETLNDTEVNRAKAQMKAGLLMALESSEARVGQIARQMLAYGRPIPLEEIVAKVDAVTVESARAAGRALIGRARPAIAALGPGSGLASTAAIAESLVRRAA